MILGAKKIIDIVDKYSEADSSEHGGIGEPGYLKSMRDIKDIVSKWLEVQRVSNAGPLDLSSLMHNYISSTNWRYDGLNGSLYIAQGYWYVSGRQMFYDDNEAFRKTPQDEVVSMNLDRNESLELAKYLNKELFPKGKVPDGYISEDLYREHVRNLHDIISQLLNKININKLVED